MNYRTNPCTHYQHRTASVLLGILLALLEAVSSQSSRRRSTTSSRRSTQPSVPVTTPLPLQSESEADPDNGLVAGVVLSGIVLLCVLAVVGLKYHRAHQAQVQTDPSNCRATGIDVPADQRMLPTTPPTPPPRRFSAGTFGQPAYEEPVETDVASLIVSRRPDPNQSTTLLSRHSTTRLGEPQYYDVVDESGVVAPQPSVTLDGENYVSVNTPPRGSAGPPIPQQTPRVLLTPSFYVSSTEI